MRKWINVLLPLLAALVLIYLRFLPPVKKAKAKAYTYAFLPGCPAHKDGSMSTSQILRCQLAIQAWQQNLYQTLIISGGAVKNQYVEAEVMASCIRQFAPIPMILETEARNTFENFQNTAAIVQDHSVLILCSSLHARRCSAIGSKFFKTFGVMTYPDWKPRHIMREIVSRWVYIQLEIRKLLGGS